MIATRKNQMVSKLFLLGHGERQSALKICCRSRFRTVGDLTMHKKEEEYSQERIQSHKTEQREEPISSGNVLRIALGSTKQAVHQPGLTADFGCQPSGSIGDVWQGQAEHEDPKHPAALVQFAAPQQKCGHSHY